MPSRQTNPIPTTWTKRSLLPKLLPLVIAAVVLSFLLTQFNIDFRATFDVIAKSNRYFYASAFFCYYLTFLFRGVRWRLIAQNSGIPGDSSGVLPSVMECTILLLIGWFVNSVSWFRMGDGYRAYAFAQSSKSGLSISLGIIVAERLMDIVAVLFLLLISVGSMFLNKDIQPSLGLLLGVASFTMAGASLLLVLARFGTTVAKWVPLRWQNAYLQFLRGALGSFRRLPFVALLSIIGWLLEAGRLLLVAESLSTAITLPMVLFVALVNAILTSIPLTPGGLGIVEPGLVGLLALGLPRSNAIAVVILDRSVSYLSIVVLGGAVFIIRQIWHRFHRT